MLLPFFIRTDGKVVRNLADAMEMQKWEQQTGEQRA